MSEEGEYINEIAPLTRDLPVIMTMCTPKERQKVILAVQKRIGKNGEWTGFKCKGYGKQWRATYDMHTQRSNEQARANKRAIKRRHTLGKRANPRGMVRFIATHALLLASGSYPTEERNVASHLCHLPSCVMTDHLIWENAGHNARRERLCVKYGECICRLTPKCLLNIHAKNLPHHQEQ